MANKREQAGAKRAALRSRRAGTPRGAAILEPADVRTILFDLANQLAPADLRSLMGHAAELRARADQLGAADPPLLRQQVNLALDLLRDHLNGACPQIPYYTIALLGAAVCYFSEKLDVIPDFLPRVGRLDDAAVMAMAYQLGENGLRRYCDAKGIGGGPVLGVPAPSRRA